jgi:hypothetical protein
MKSAAASPLESKKVKRQISRDNVGSSSQHTMNIMNTELYASMPEFESDLWEANVPSFQSGEMPSEYVRSNLNEVYFVFPKNCLEKKFFQSKGFNWIKYNGICDKLMFYPNQIDWLSSIIKNRKDKMRGIISNPEQIMCGTFPKEFDIYTLFPELNQVAVNIYANFVNDEDWLRNVLNDKNMFTKSRFLISKSVCTWYKQVKAMKLWEFRQYWTCKMWVVWLVLHIVQKLVSMYYIDERKHLSVSKNNCTVPTESSGKQIMNIYNESPENSEERL